MLSWKILNRLILSVSVYRLSVSYLGEFGILLLSNKNKSYQPLRIFGC